MIQIIEQPDGRFVLISSVTDFCGSMGYCEFRIKHLLKGIKPAQTELTIAGTKAHEKEEEYEKEHVKFEPLTREKMEDRKKDIELFFVTTCLFTDFGNDIYNFIMNTCQMKTWFLLYNLYHLKFKVFFKNL